MTCKALRSRLDRRYIRIIIIIIIIIIFFFFSSLELDRLRAMFKEMITTSVPISKPKVKEILEKEDGGKELLQKALLETIIM